MFALEESALIGGVVPSEANKDDTSKTEVITDTALPPE